jgi:hypothetical protein
MKLMTKEIEKKAQAQYALGSSLEDQMVVAKFFDPCGSWTWYLMNQDPEDPDYLWGIVKGFEFEVEVEVEIGSFSLSELQSVKNSLGIGMERDLHFRPRNAKEVYDAVYAGKHV